jgi:hypothetical protein
MKSKKKPPARRRPSPAPKPRKTQPPFPVSDAERDYWRDWLIAQSKYPREPRLDPTALNRETLRALQIIIHLLQLCPCQIEKRTHISHQHQRKLRLAAATDGNHHLSLHPFSLQTLTALTALATGLRLNLQR